MDTNKERKEKVINLKDIELLNIKLDKAIIKEDGKLEYDYSIEGAHFIEEVLEDEDMMEHIESLMEEMLDATTKVILESIVEGIINQKDNEK